jgi:hypothetical protein
VNSLTTGKITGNFYEFYLFRVVLSVTNAKSHNDLKSLREIPCSFPIREFSLPKQGIIRRNRELPVGMPKKGDGQLGAAFRTWRCCFDNGKPATLVTFGADARRDTLVAT